MMKPKGRRNKAAFTLIEVLLVAGILALLAAFAIPRLFGQAREAQIKITEATVGRNGPIGKALEAYRWDMGVLPETDEGLQALYQRKDSVDDERYKGPYMEGTFEELIDPWGSSFQYVSPGEVNDEGYDLWSMGKDGIDDGGKEGTDDIKNWREN